MRFLLIGLVLLASACAAQTPERGEPEAAPETVAAVDGAGNRLEALVANGERWCTADGGWCAAADGTATYGGAARTLESLEEGHERGVWPFVVFVGGKSDHVLMGFTDTLYEMYSGGGASYTALTLYEMTGRNPTEIEPLLAVQSGANVMIRACFGENDMRARRDACHDEYTFAATINLDPNVTSGHPRFLYASEAATYPGAVSRTSDSAERGPLRAADLVWARDETCSLTRTFALAGENGYMPDAALPECSNYSAQ